MVHQAAGIDSLLKLRDLTLAVGSGKPFARYLLHKLGDAQLTVVPYQGNVGLFLQRADVAQQAYVFSEPFIARQQGGDPQCLMLSDIGFNPYASVLVVHEQLIAADPDLVARVVRACVQAAGSKYLEDPAPTNQHIQELNAEMSRGYPRLWSAGDPRAVPSARHELRSVGTACPPRGGKSWRSSSTKSICWTSATSGETRLTAVSFRAMSECRLSRCASTSCRSMWQGLLIGCAALLSFRGAQGDYARSDSVTPRWISYQKLIAASCGSDSKRAIHSCNSGRVSCSTSRLRCRYVRT